MSIICPAGCGKKFINEYHIKRHLEVMHKEDTEVVKRKGWVTPYGFGDFKEPITYEEACETMKTIIDSIAWPKTDNQIEVREVL